MCPCRGRESGVLQLWVIALLATVYLHDQLVEGLHRHAPAEPLEWWRVVAALLPFVAISAATQLVCWASGKEMDRRGSLRAVRTADRMLAVSKLAAVMTHVLNVFVLGWVGQVRAVVGDTIMMDELLAVSPALLTFIAGWWSYHPIEQRIRRASLIRVLEEGRPAYPEQSRGQFVWSNIRHQVLFVLVPVGLMGCWSESATRVLAWMMRHQYSSGIVGRVGRWFAHDPAAEAARFGIQLIGIAAVFLFAPALMRLVWDAVPLGPGPLRDRLMRICDRAGVRVRELLVWRTYGTMINGAAMGLIAPLRYILLTDALLDHLPGRQVESVMAHEVGHAKHHHIPWLVLGLMGAMGLIGVGIAIGLMVVGVTTAFVWRGQPSTFAAAFEFAQVGAMPIVLILGFASFGWISRRFEWQADAFAAKELSRDEPETKVVTQEAVDAMCGALGAVSHLGHADPRKWSFRHGSIDARQRRLLALVGVPLDRLPIDRLVGWIKGGITVGIAMLVLAIAAPALLGGLGEMMRRPVPMTELDRYRMKFEQSTLEDAP